METEPSRDQVLADFQSCTGMQDVEACLSYLNAANWDLLDAISQVMPNGSQSLPRERTVSPPVPMSIEHSESRNDLGAHSNDDVVALEQNVPMNIGPPDSGQIIETGGGTSDDPVVLGGEGDQTTVLNVVFYGSDLEVKSTTLFVVNCMTVGEVKAAILGELGVPICSQRIEEWQHLPDEMLLSSLRLGNRFTIHVSSKNTASDNQAPGRPDNTYEGRFIRLVIVNESNENSQHTITCPATRRYRDVREDIFAVTSIPVRHQRIQGLPASSDDVPLGSLTDQDVVHITISRNAQQSESVVEVLNDSDSDNECFVYDGEEELFGGNEPPRPTLAGIPRPLRPTMDPLIPENVASEEEGVRLFKENFEKRYGDSHPIVFINSLKEAYAASCLKPCKERRPLAVYLHHDRSIFSNIFCTQILCSENIASYLNVNFVFWPWDLTSDPNRDRFVASVMTVMGSNAGQAVRTLLHVDHLPAIVIVTRLRSVNEIITIPNATGVDELMTRLVNVIEAYNNDLVIEAQEEAERDARERVKMEQDLAYQQSLAVDKAKEEARQQEQNARMEREMAEERKRVEAAEKQQHDDNLKKAMQASLAEMLPPEPDEKSSHPVSHIRIRLPTGELLSRRFRGTDPLDVLLRFLASKGYPANEFKVLLSWPKTDVCQMDTCKTLQELNLYPKETLTVEERDLGEDKLRG